jgi:hypothetical protein
MTAPAAIHSSSKGQLHLSETGSESRNRRMFILLVRQSSLRKLLNHTEKPLILRERRLPLFVALRGRHCPGACNWTERVEDELTEWRLRV